MPEQILIIDEQPLLRKGVKQLLSQEFKGVFCGEAATPAEAMEALEETPWDVVFLDISMARVTGLDLLAQVRAAVPQVPVLVYSIEPEEQWGVSVLRLGAVGYVLKSAPTEELVKAVRLALMGQRYLSPSITEQLVSALGCDTVKPPHRFLSRSEYAVFSALIAGKSLSDVARLLDRSPKTVSTFRARVFRKLGVKSTVEMVHYAMRHDLIRHNGH